MTRDVKKKADVSHGQDAYGRLIEEIRRGELRPRQRLTETEIAARLGISRTPVREAIRQLEADGLVVHIPRVGAVIRSLDYSEVTELYEMRAVLEGTAARLTARTAAPVEIAELEAINEEMVRSTGDAHHMSDLNRQFHQTMLNAAKNRFLSRSVEALEKTLLILGPTTMEETERAHDALEEHAAVLDAIREGDELRAETAMRRHIEAAQRVRLRQFRARPTAGEPTTYETT